MNTEDQKVSQLIDKCLAEFSRILPHLEYCPICEGDGQVLLYEGAHEDEIEECIVCRGLGMVPAKGAP